jgi:hypothetical protein
LSAALSNWHRFSFCVIGTKCSPGQLQELITPGKLPVEIRNLLFENVTELDTAQALKVFVASAGHGASCCRRLLTNYLVAKQVVFSCMFFVHT